MHSLRQVLGRPLLAACTLVSLAASPAAAQPDTSSIWHSAGAVAPVDAAREPVYGQPASDFSVIVWLDPECPYCKMLGRTPELVVDASGGRVNLAVRLLPLPMHGRAAFMAAATALCIGQQTPPAGYYRFLDRYMELTRTNGAGLPASTSVEALAQEAGVRDLPKLDACVHAPETVQTLGQEFDAANAAKVTGTPAIVVRDNRTGNLAMTEGAISADDISRVIRALGAQGAD
ncbi:thioredoxin domain-containing protein [Novosphingobium sp.]|uniref:DsbA family protein n=1 Tax=Novosphingobium sp. TaxID=1874826 RepID=UPI00262937FA|nr:thioredoxin domain-containing protein [Novosphingobium sp.]